ncbi:uncharacterized protein LOC100207912 isoform X2 [Hydra vulgaris]|uniref:peptidylprolyl isomerase n=1 Tax=Hydra vulgaris TaxID=6087 RepID=A0ABM4CZ43_HYDVU
MENIEINYTNTNSGSMQQIINSTGSEHIKDIVGNEESDSLNCLSNPNTAFKEYQISGHTDVLNHLNKEFIDEVQSNNGCTDFINSTSNGYSGFLDHSIECDDTYRFNNEHPDVIEHSPNEHTRVMEVSSNNQPSVMNSITPVKSYIQSPGKRINDVSVEDAQNSAELTENGFPDVSIAHSAEVLSCLLDSGKRVNELPVEVAQNLSERTENGFPDVTIAHSAEVLSCLLDSGKRVNELPVEVAQSLSERTENGFPDVSVEHSAEVLSSLLDSGKRANELPVEVAQSLSERTENGFPDVTVLTINFDEEKYDSEAKLLYCHQKSDNDIQEKEIVETIKSSPCQEKNAAVTNELFNNAAVTSELLNKQTFDQAQIDDRSENSLHKNHSQIESQSSEKQYLNQNQHLNQSGIVVLSKKTPELESVIIEDNLFSKETPELESVINENLFLNETHELESVINEKILFLNEVPKLDTVKNEECLFNKELKTETDNFTSIQKDILLEQPQNTIFNPDLTHNTENKKETSNSLNAPENNPKKETSHLLNTPENNPKKETSDSLNAPEVDKTYSKLPTAKNEDIPLHLSSVEQDLVQLPSVTYEKIEISDFTTENKNLSSADQKSSLTSSPTVIDDSTEWLDILGNGLLKKKVLRKGLGHKSRPVSGDIVTIKCKGMLSDGTIVDAHDSLQFVLSDEEVIQAFDLSVALMENTEVACIFTDARYAYGIYGRPNFIPPIPQNASLTYEVEILSVKPGPDITQLSSEERIKYANAKRERGNELYMIGDHSSSINVYKRGLKYVEGSSEMNVLEMKVKLLNNLSAAQLKVNAYAMAIVSLDSVLRVEPKNTKALFRKGKCLEGLGNDEEALKCLKEASTLDPHNKLIHQDIAKVRSRLAVTQKKEKEIYEKMFSQKKKEKVIQNEPSVWPYIIGSSLVAAIGVISGILWFRKHS